MEENNRGLVSSVFEVAAMVVVAFLLALLIQQFVVKPFAIQQVSMLPTLHDGDRVLINRFLYGFGEPERGDIVVLESPVVESLDLVKRIVAVEGDTVAVRDGRLVLNGEVQDEPYLNEAVMNSEIDELTVPADHVYVMGDNRNASGDSRVFGPVPEGNLLGEAFLVYWPPSRWQLL